VQQPRERELRRMYGPCMSAVSKNVTPSSTARWIVTIDSASSVAP
jgi:hypothetical protein